MTKAYIFSRRFNTCRDAPPLMQERRPAAIKNSNNYANHGETPLLKIA